MSDFDRFDMDRGRDYDFFYEEKIYKNGKDIGRKRTQSNGGAFGTLAYMSLMGLGFLIAVFCAPIGALIILAACSLKDSL